ncbi:large ribosomal subunit protein bL35c [Cornus florida]|uniref:large ribosomal subunit protein bL35c n=1 Tax=Cornus florida TaxID=4283 RepID=UPI002899F601|nr:large ribosomal subunit protein bL35c [Cornus florida]
MTTTTMASPTTMFSLGSILSPSSILSSRRIVRLSAFTKKTSLNLSSSHNISGFAPILPNKLFTVTPLPRNPQSFTVFAAKGYKMKTHKASAKRFRVTGSGKIMRRRAGKQHLLGKKNTKRKLRLSKMLQVDRSDYDNVIGALPYLKVNRAK